MTLLTTIKKAHGNLWRTKFRSLLTILSVFVGALSLALILTASNGLQLWIDDQLQSVDNMGNIPVLPDDGQFGFRPDLSFVKKYEEGMELPFVEGANFLKQEDIEKLEKIDNILEVKADPSTMVLPRYIQYQNSDRVFSGIRTFYSNMNLPLYAGELPKEGEDKKILLSYNVANVMGYEEPKELLNKKVTMSFRSDNGDTFKREYTVGGILKNTVIFSSHNYIPDNEVKEIYKVSANQSFENNSEEQEYYVLTALYDPKIAQEKLDKIEKDITDAGYKIETVKSGTEMFKQVLSGLQLGLGLFATIALVVGFFGVINTLITSSLERTKEIGLMRALGESKGGVFRLFAIEAGLIGFWGSVAGILISMLIGMILNPMIVERGILGIKEGGIFITNLNSILIVIATITGVTLIAGILPAVKAANTDPVNSLKYE